MADDNSKSELYKALAQFHKNLKQPSKDAKNPFFKSNYVTLQGVQQAVDKACEGTGLSYSQMVFDAENGGKAVKTIITHESGQTLSMGELSLTPTKKDPQGYGSAITYAKRYQLAAAFGISSELDDDGNNASTVNKKNSSYKNQQNYVKKQSQSQRSDIENLANKYQQKLATAAQALNDSTASIQRRVVKTCREEIKGYSSFDQKQQLEQWINILDGMIKQAMQGDLFEEDN